MWVAHSGMRPFGNGVETDGYIAVTAMLLAPQLASSRALNSNPGARFEMKLQQLRFLAAMAQNDLNLTAAAAKLLASQPAVSKQVRLLEEELGFNIFVRNGRSFTAVTAQGRQVIAHAMRMLREVKNIRRMSEEVVVGDSGSLSVGTTHTQARYVLPPAVSRFRERCPGVQLHLHQGTPEQIAEMGALDRIDFAVATGSESLFADWVLLPCNQWRHRIIVPRAHALAQQGRVSLQQLSAHPLVTYVSGPSGTSTVHDAFECAGLSPEIILSARDSDIIKTYVRLGLGVGIVADLALDPAGDADLVSIDATHLFSPHTSWVGFMRGGVLRRFMYDFLQCLAPHLTPARVDEADKCLTQQAVDELFAVVELPAR